MYIKTQKFLILGVSKSGFAVGKFILEHGGQCYLFEELSSSKIDQSISELLELGAKKVGDDDVGKILLDIDVVVISPGVPINHRVAVKARNLNKRIIGELEFGYLQFLPPIIAITGTNGKTTTVTLVDSILNEQKLNSELVGNVGVPITQKVCNVDKDTIYVAEVSSFQLESVSSFCPHISCVLNISPDHLERHYNMQNYIYLKKRIFKNQKESEYTILNFDDEVVRSFSSEVKAKCIFVSLKEKVDGAYRIDDNLYYNDELIINQNDLRLKGEHNAFNALVAIAIAKIIGVENKNIVNALKNFKGVRHRMEFIANKFGVDFYNDSKATNTASTINAIDGVQKPKILILGGSEKGESYNELFDKIKNSNVKHVVLMGASRFNMLDSAKSVGFANVTLTCDFNNAIKIAKLISQEGDCVLLSPACASFDYFTNFEERGDKFKEIVEGF